MTQKTMLVRKNRKDNPKSHTDTNLRNGATHIAVLHFTITVKNSTKWVWSGSQPTVQQYLFLLLSINVASRQLYRFAVLLVYIIVLWNILYYVIKWLVAGLWFSPGITVSSTNKTDLHEITDLLLKVVLNTIILILISFL